MAETPEPLRAAIVDDDRLIRHLVRATLESSGYVVVEGETGAAGLRLAQDKPDVLVLDLNLPDLNGIAVCRAVRNSPATADVAVVFLTGSNDERTVVSCLQAGANDYVSKPFAPAVLAARIDAVVRARRAEQARRRFVDELSEAYRALREARAESMLQHRLSGLGVLAAGIAHEMNTPLGALLSTLQFMEEEPKPSDAEMKDALSDAIIAANRIAELVTRMRQIAGTGERDLKEIDLRARAEQVAKAFAEQAVLIEVSGPSVSVTAVETEVREALMALIENAVQASADVDGARVQVTVALAGEHATVVIDDNGPGIEAADLPFLFDPFFTKKRVWKTSGLGLSIAQAAARRHGGDVEVEAHGPLGGARARLTLPVKPTLPAEAERPLLLKTMRER